MPNVRFVRSAVFAVELRALSAAPETTVRVLEDSLEAGTSTGTFQLALGRLFRALGREPEAVRAFADVFTLPDRNLSYYFARSALSSLTGRPLGGR
jgi:lipopolysaccharide biosynthesis regulator YciM